MSPQGPPRAFTETALDLAASPPVLWATFSSIDKWPRWSKSVRSARWVAGTEWTLGAQLELALDLPFPAGAWRGVAVIAEIQPAISVSWETEYPFDVVVVHSYRFQPSELGTVLVVREAYYGSWVWLYRLSGFPRQRCKAFEIALRNLKTYLEVGTLNEV